MRHPPNVFMVPDALVRLASERGNANASDLVHQLRFTTTLHLGPDQVTPGMHLNSRVPRGSGVLAAAYLRDQLMGQLAGGSACRVVLVTLLRHPVDQLVSAWHYTRRRVPLQVFAKRHSTTLLGVLDTPGALQLKPGSPSNPFTEYVRAKARAQPGSGLDTLLSFFDVVGHTERFEESLLLLTDAAGLQEPLGCPLSQNRGSYTPNASEAQVVAAALGGVEAPLIAWYAKRLAAFDRSNEIRENGQFLPRVKRLSELRAAHAAALGRGSSAFSES